MRFLDLSGYGLFGRMETGAETVAVLGLIATAASTAVSVDAQRKQGRYQAEVETQNQQTGLIAAADAIHRGDIEADAARVRTRLLIGEQRAKYAAAGVELGTGSPLDVTTSTAAIGELDALTIKSNAQREAWGYVAQSEDYANRARLTRLAAKNQSGSTLLTGGNAALNQYSRGLDTGVF